MKWYKMHVNDITVNAHFISIEKCNDKDAYVKWGFT